MKQDPKNDAVAWAMTHDFDDPYEMTSEIQARFGLGYYAAMAVVAKAMSVRRA